ncbi:MAG: pilus assembly protein N-terminal domain-containing protein [Deltaproteobacteria bacterium]|nr:pilus assembly protein N-terminal domain-containing protein [Deltaproteobacteria bacterium]
MRTFAALVLALGFLTSPARADDEPKDPKGTRQLKLSLGERRSIHMNEPGTRAVCDDPSIVKADLSDAEGVTLEGIGLGTTLCGLRGPGGTQHGLYRVTVVPPPSKSHP